MNDICENFHGGNEFSAAANESADPVARAAECDKIFEWVESLDGTGATCDEAESYFAKDVGFPKSLSPRWTELKAHGRIAPNGEKRKTKLHCFAEVYVSAAHPSAKQVPVKASPGTLRDYIAQLVALLKCNNIEVPAPPPGL